MTQSPYALIIGGTSGIGLATAEKLIKQNINLIILGSNPQKLDHALSQLAGANEHHVHIEGHAVDLANETAVSNFVQHIQEDDRHLRYLVNAAGYFSPKPFLEHQANDYDIYAKFNRAIFFLSQAVALNMKQHNAGSIVNIGSMWAKQAIKATPSSAYSMAKAGLHSLTQHMAMELAEYNIRVNAVSPAVVKTPIYESFVAPEEIDQTLASFDEFHPIGRIGTPDDVATSIVFLLQDSSSWTTGTILDIDGGVMSGRN